MPPRQRHPIGGVEAPIRRRPSFPVLLYHTFLDIPQNVLTAGIIVPQEVYRSRRPFVPREPITFLESGHLGVRLVNASNGRLGSLENPDTRILLSRHTRISCRILVSDTHEVLVITHSLA